MSKYSDYTKAWRKAHPEKRKRDRTSYYHHHDYGRGDRSKYSIPECLAVLNHNIPDVTLAMNLCRSVRSIHVKRSKLLKEMEEGKHAHLLKLSRSR